MKIVETKQQGIKSAYTLTQGDRVLTLHVLTDLAIYREDQNTETLFVRIEKGLLNSKVDA
jgi:hypothetical protein